MTASRTLIKTKTAGWYEDPASPGSKVRKQEGDKIVSRSEWEKANEKAKSTSKPKGEVVILSTGKEAHGPTTTIRCQHITSDGKCGADRIIQVQDIFQVKFCIEHQKEERNKLRRERRKNKAKAAKK